MKSKLQRVRDDPDRIKAIGPRHQTPTREIVAALMIERKAYNRAAAEVKGRFDTRAELIGFLANEVEKNEHSWAKIAADAQIPFTTLRYLIYARKVPRFVKKNR